MTGVQTCALRSGDSLVRLLRAKKIDITDKKYFLIDYVPVEKVSPQRIQDALLILNEVEKCTNTQVFSLWRLMEKVRTLKSYNSENV